MKIYNSQVNKKEKVGNKEKRDELNISKEAHEYQWALDLAKEVPDIRVDKVEKIKHEISSGTYYVDGKKIAEKMIDDANFDKKI